MSFFKLKNIFRISDSKDKVFISIFLLGTIQFFSYLFLMRYFDFVYTPNYSLIFFSSVQILALVLNVILYKKKIFKVEYFVFVALPALLVMSYSDLNFSLIALACALFAYIFVQQILLVRLFVLSAESINKAYLFEMLGGILGVLLWYFASAHLGFKGFVYLNIIIIFVFFAFFYSHRLLLGYVVCSIMTALFLSEPHPVEDIRERYELVKASGLQKKVWDPNGTIEVVNLGDNLKAILFEAGRLRTSINKFDQNYVNLREQYNQSRPIHLWGLDVAAPHFLINKKDYSAVLISAVGGQEILAAKAFGAKKIAAVDINKSAQEEVAKTYYDFSGQIYKDISVHNLDGRIFIARSKELFDVIQIYSAYNASFSSSLGPEFVPTSLMTIEALKDYVSKLSDEGILQITQGNILKNKFIFEAAFGENIFSTSAHLIVYKRKHNNNILINYLYRKRAWSKDEVSAFEKWLSNDEKTQWEFLYNPYKPNESRPSQSSVSHLPNLKTPVTDDWPFYFLTKSTHSVFQIQFLATFAFVLLLVHFLLAKFKQNTLGESTSLLVMGANFAFAQGILIFLFQRVVGNPALGLSAALIALLFIVAMATVAFHSRYNSKNLALLNIVSSLAVVFIFIAKPVFYKNEALIFALLSFAFVQSFIYQKYVFELRSKIGGVILSNGVGVVSGTIIFHLLFVSIGLNKTIQIACFLYFVCNAVQLMLSKKIR